MLARLLSGQGVPSTTSPVAWPAALRSGQTQHELFWACLCTCGYSAELRGAYLACPGGHGHARLTPPGAELACRQRRPGEHGSRFGGVTGRERGHRTNAEGIATVLRLLVLYPC